MKQLQERLDRPAKDRGAALILVLIIVTVIGLAGAALLTFSDTSIRTTVALRDQAAAAYAADGAAQVAISEIQNGKLDCSSTTPTVVPLGTATSPFYIPVQSQVGPLNATITCSPNTSTLEGASSTTKTTIIPGSGSGTTVGGTAGNLPSYALLAMGGDASTDYGINVAGGAAGQTICIENGNVVSNTNIDAIGGSLGVRLSDPKNSGDCTTGSGLGLTVGAVNNTTATTGCMVGGTFSPTPCTQRASKIDLPTAPAPTDPITVATTNQDATCFISGSNKYAAFLPGLYTDIEKLNSPCGGDFNFEWFSPGTYYFDFGDFVEPTTNWAWPVSLLAGTPTDSTSTAITTVDASKPSSLIGLDNVAVFPTSKNNLKPNSCVDPALQNGSAGVKLGVEFVFGGGSTFSPNPTGNAEICASYSSEAPPIAIYGPINKLDVTGGSVRAETLCTTSGCGTSTLINTTTKDSSGHPQFYIKGFVYAPNAQIELVLKQSLGQIFNWGVVVRNFKLSTNSAYAGAPFIQLPSANQGFVPGTTTTITTTTYTVRYISVWTCPANASPCPQTDPISKDPIPANVRVKVQTNGSSVKVLSWSVQR